VGKFGNSIPRSIEMDVGSANTPERMYLMGIAASNAISIATRSLLVVKNSFTIITYRFGFGMMMKLIIRKTSFNPCNCSIAKPCAGVTTLSVVRSMPSSCGDLNSLRSAQPAKENLPWFVPLDQEKELSNSEFLRLGFQVCFSSSISHP
jgi:hypothetical protein